MYTNMNGRMLQQQQQNLQNKHTQIMGFTQQQQQQQVDQQQTQLSMKQPNYTYNNNNNNPSPSPTQKPNIGMTQMTNSTDDDETNCSNDQENNSSDSKRKSSVDLSMSSSQWQRMKWTDNMVRLLIMAVYYIGDEAGGGGPETGPEKKKSLGALQKKGKWKSVSKAMMEKGFYVSPQQCEDKFNDLNKRYKRVNDILGRGTACKVVENQSLLQGMDVAPKLKDEVKKLLNSKHLFFREMCAYHNSCGHVTSGGGSAHAGAGAETVTVVVGPGAQHQQQVMQTQRQESPCLHSGQMKSNGIAHTTTSLMGGGDEEEDDDEDEEEDDEDEDHEDGNARKRARTMQGGPGFGLSQWGGEVMGMLQDGSKSLFEKKQWVRTQMIELEENGVKFQREALELDKERLKWMKFSSKKEREMERMKIDNEKKRLENERMVLLLRKKEIEFLFIEQH